MTSMEKDFTDVHKLRLCLLIPLFYTANNLHLQTQRLADRGANVLVVARKSPSHPQRSEAYGTVNITRVAPCMSGRIANYAMMLPAFVELLRRRHSYDLIWVVKFSTLGIVGTLAARILGKGCVLEAECNDEMSGEHFFHLNEWRLCHTRLFRSIFNAGMVVRNWLLRQADCFMAISREIEREFLDSGVPKDRICYKPCGIDTDRFAPISGKQKQLLRQKLSLPTNDLIICYCGRLVHNKGLECLLQAWKDISHEHGDVHLLIVGSGNNWFGGIEDALRAFVKSEGLTTTTTFTGYADNVEEYLSASDIFVYPSENEALGVAIIEAMACGLPVVASGVGGIRDLVVPGETGILTEPRRADHITEALRSVIVNPDRRREMGVKGRHHAKAYFSIDRINSLNVQAFTAVYRSKALPS